MTDSNLHNGLMISRKHLQQHRSSQTLINGKAAKQGNFTTFLFHISELIVN